MSERSSGGETSSSRDSLERLAEAFLERYRRGERPGIAEFEAQHPELAEDIRELFPALVEIEGLKSDEPEGWSGPTGGSSLSRLGDFRILREVGRGGMGVVYEAVQETLGRRVALKVLPPEFLRRPNALERFRREARSAAGLHHTNIVPVYGVGEADGHHYYAMQYIPGQTLATILEEIRCQSAVGSVSPHTGGPADDSRSTLSLAASIAQGLLTGNFARLDTTDADSDRGGVPGRSPAASPSSGLVTVSDARSRPADWRYGREIARVGLQVAEALAFAHEHGVLHRDIKPSNLLMDLSGTIWVADFGLAKLVEGEDLTDSRDLVGTLRYMAPERFDGRADARGDVYSLGVTLYELLTLQSPFPARERPKLFRQILHARPAPPRAIHRNISRDLETIVLKAMARDPDERYASAEAMAEDLRRFLSDRTILARRTPVVERTWRWCRRNRAVAALGALAIVAMLGLAIVSLAFGLAQRAQAIAMARVLDEARRQRRTATELAAAATYERALDLSDRGALDAGLLVMAESLRLAESSTGEGTFEPSPLSGVIRRTIADVAARSHALIGFLGHDAAIDDLAISRDGRIVATAGRDGSARVWSADSGRLLASFRHGRPVQSVRFACDGRSLLTVTSTSVTLWDVLGGHRLRVFEHPAGVLAAALDNAGRRLVLAGADGLTQVFGIEEGSPLGSPLRHQQAVRAARFAGPGDSLVITASDDLTARLWEVASGRPVGEPMPLTGPPTCLEVSPDGRMILIGSQDGGARLWDTSTGRPVGPPLIHGTSPVVVATFRPDGRAVVTGSRDWRARIWAINVGGALGQPQVIVHQAPVTAVCYTADGQMLVTGCRNGQAFIWDPEAAEPIHTLPHLGEVFCAAVSPDGRTVVSGGQEGLARLWRIPPRPSRPLTITEHGIFYTMAFSPDRATLATGGEAGVVELWETRTGRRIGALPHGGEVRAAVFLPGGRSLVSAGDDQTAALWDLSDGSLIRRFGHPKEVDSAAISPDGMRLLTGDRAGVVRLWEVETGKILREALLHTGPVQAIAFRPDGLAFGTASFDQTARLARVETLEPIGPPLRHQGVVWAIAFRPDGRMLVTAGEDRSVMVWDAETGLALQSPLDHGASIRSVAFSPDGQRLLVAGPEGTSRFQDLATGQPVGTRLVGAGHVLAATFEPTDGSIVTAGTTTSVQGDDLVVVARYPPHALISGDPAAITRHLRVMTGKEIRPGGYLQVLDQSTWEREAALEATDARSINLDRP